MYTLTKIDIVDMKHYKFHTTDAKCFDGELIGYDNIAYTNKFMDTHYEKGRGKVLKFLITVNESEVIGNKSHYYFYYNFRADREGILKDALARTMYTLDNIIHTARDISIDKKNRVELVRKLKNKYDCSFYVALKVLSYVDWDTKKAEKMLKDVIDTKGEDFLKENDIETDPVDSRHLQIAYTLQHRTGCTLSTAYQALKIANWDLQEAIETIEFNNELASA